MGALWGMAARGRAERRLKRPALFLFVGRGEARQGAALVW